MEKFFGRKRKNNRTQQIRKFREKFKGRIKKVMIIDLEKEGIVEGIEIIPAWKFLLNWQEFTIRR
ncbi:MAG: hypothetical protein C3F06_04440 [Candidatus Methanoperedenaceae archaeon]|nr:MAG: hypothetical protein C3F06_04440 [Candidatus Methanoperedenaceae archaeon]